MLEECSTDTAPSPRVWDMKACASDTSNPHVEVREAGLDPQGARMAHVTIRPGGIIRGTTHPGEHEYVVVLRGRVIADIDGIDYKGEFGVVFNIPEGAVHGYRPDGEEVVELLAIYKDM